MKNTFSNLTRGGVSFP